MKAPENIRVQRRNRGVDAEKQSSKRKHLEF